MNINIEKTAGTGFCFGVKRAITTLEKTAIEMADAIIAVSKETKEDVLKYFDVDEKKIKVIYNGINLQEYVVTEDSSALDAYGIDITVFNAYAAADAFCFINDNAVFLLIHAPIPRPVFSFL